MPSLLPHPPLPVCPFALLWLSDDEIVVVSDRCPYEQCQHLFKETDVEDFPDLFRLSKGWKPPSTQNYEDRSRTKVPRTKVPTDKSTHYKNNVTEAKNRPEGGS